MVYLKNWTDNFFRMFFMGTSWVAISINNIKTRANREMTSRKNIKIFYFNGVNVAKQGMWRGEVFAISDCLVLKCNYSLDDAGEFRKYLQCALFQRLYVCLSFYYTTDKLNVCLLVV